MHSYKLEDGINIGAKVLEYEGVMNNVEREIEEVVKMAKKI